VAATTSSSSRKRSKEAVSSSKVNRQAMHLTASELVLFVRYMGTHRYKHATLVYNASNTHIDYTVLHGEVSATAYSIFTMYMYTLHTCTGSANDSSSSSSVSSAAEPTEGINSKDGYYVRLGLNRDATAADIKASYRKLAMQVRYSL
jgi:hypothetical protein